MKASNPAISALTAALQARNVDTTTLTITYTEETCQYPGGSYQNRQITVTDGKDRRQYDARLTLENPEVTAVEWINRQKVAK